MSCDIIQKYKIQVHTLRFMCNKIPSIFGICIDTLKQHVVQLDWLARFHSLGSPILLSKSFCKLIKLQNLTVPCFPVLCFSGAEKAIYRDSVECHSISVSRCMGVISRHD